MNPLLWMLLGAATVASLPLLGLLVSLVVEVARNRAHERQVRAALAAGWAPPRINAAWSIVNVDEIVFEGVSAVEPTPDRGISVRSYTERARQVQRRVEEAWLAGIKDAEHKERQESTR